MMTLAAKMLNPVTIEPAKEKDIPAIQAVAEMTWQDTFTSIIGAQKVAQELKREYSFDSLKQQMENGQQFVVLKDNGMVVAYASCSIEQALPIPVTEYWASKTPLMKLHKLYCLPQFQNNGYGKLLLTWVKTYAEDQDLKALMLLVNRNNKAVGFYESQGFEILGELNTQYGNVVREDYVMAKALVSA